MHDLTFCKNKVQIIVCVAIYLEQDRAVNPRLIRRVYGGGILLVQQFT